MPLDLLVVTILKALTELVGWFLLGQGATYVLTRVMRQEPQHNIVYQILSILTRPVLRFVRMLTPRAVIDKHIPLVTVLLLIWIYFVLATWKVTLCGTYAAERYEACAPYVQKQE